MTDFTLSKEDFLALHKLTPENKNAAKKISEVERKKQIGILKTVR